MNVSFDSYFNGLIVRLMAVDPKEPERGIFTAVFSIPSSCACSANSNSTRGNELTTSTSTNSPFLGMCEFFTN